MTLDTTGKFLLAFWGVVIGIPTTYVMVKAVQGNKRANAKE